MEKNSVNLQNFLYFVNLLDLGAMPVNIKSLQKSVKHVVLTMIH